MYRPSCDSIIFDLDGTLWDASPTSAIAWSKVASEHGIEVTIDESAIKGVSGLPFDKCVDVLFGSHAQTIPNLRTLLDESEQKEILDRGGRFYPGMTEGLRRLGREYKLFLVSNCQEWYLNAFLNHSGLKDVFQDSICFGQTNLPKSENIKTIVKRNHLERPIYVGDTHWDQEAAFYAGVKFIFARFGFGSIKVSSPSISSMDDLVKLMTAPELTSPIEIKKLTANDFNTAAAFYQSVGYVQAIQPQDKFFGAFHATEMVGLVRLAFENNHWVLRGMQVRPNFQFFGIGTKLIRLLEQDLQNENCYCLPHGWLDKFYGQIGFKTVKSTKDCPTFLVERLAENRKKYPQLILMKRG
jgi:phosphoglycolate phosphatase